MSKKNYLDYVPVCRPGQRIQVEADGKVVLFMENRGFYNRLAQMIWKRPRMSQIYLDQLGSLAFTAMDGKRSIYEIGKIMHAAYGADAEPVYQRLAAFFKALDAADCIVYEGK